MCCTSILPDERVRATEPTLANPIRLLEESGAEENKQTELASMASTMGATNKLDLTSDVTHLIVGSIDTPKYKYVAKERPDVKCLLPQWIEDVRQSWLEGEETDVEALEKRHSTPTFFGLKICVTGFSESTRITEQHSWTKADRMTQYHSANE